MSGAEQGLGWLFVMIAWLFIFVAPGVLVFSSCSQLLHILFAVLTIIMPSKSVFNVFNILTFITSLIYLGLSIVSTIICLISNQDNANLYLAINIALIALLTVNITLLVIANVRRITHSKRVKNA